MRRLGLLALAFLPLLGAGFVFWDDRALLLTDVDVREFHVLELFRDLSRGGYFPLTRVSLALDHLLFGDDPRASHLVNILIHAANVSLVAKVLGRTFGLERKAARLGAVLFAVHPINVEAVAWISGGRKDLLAAFFTLLALGRARDLAGVVSGAFAMLAKATAVTLAPWFLLTGRLRRGLGLLPVALAVGTLELIAQRTTLHAATEAGGVLASLARASTALAFSISRYLWPRHLAIYYDRAATHLDALDVGLLALFAALAWRGRRDPLRRRALLWFALTIAPTLKLVPFGQDSVFNDRYLYVPGLGVLAFTLLSLAPLTLTRRALLWATAGAAAVIANAQARTWTSQETLWLNVRRKFPAARKVAANLSLYYLSENRPADAEPEARRAVADAPDDVEAAANLGVTLTQLGRLTEARDVYLAARARWPRAPNVLNNLGYVYLSLGERALAREAFESALEFAPGFENAREGLRLSTAP